MVDRATPVAEPPDAQGVVVTRMVSLRLRIATECAWLMFKTASFDGVLSHSLYEISEPGLIVSQFCGHYAGSIDRDPNNAVNALGHR